MIIKGLLRTLPWLGFVTILCTAHLAGATGGAFFPPGETATVKDHTVIVSLSPTQVTIWDEPQLTGNASSWAWVMPIQGTVSVGTSSDALFTNLDAQSAVSPVPPIACPMAGSCGGEEGMDMASPDGGTGGMTLLARATVGPYTMMQLSSTTPNALADWLSRNNFSLPEDIKPIISAYENERWSFLVAKLQPGANVTTMQPLRVTIPGNAWTLPLRMSAAGSAAQLPIKLYIFGSGRYEPTNAPTFVIDPKTLLWNWDTKSNNYAVLAQAGFAASQNQGWLVETAGSFDATALGAKLRGLAQSDPMGSGYGDGTVAGAQDAVNKDLDALFGRLGASVWLTRLRAELPRRNLAADLMFGLAPAQTPVSQTPSIEASTGTPPACATCEDGTEPPTTPSGGCACSAVERPRPGYALFGMLLGGVMLLRMYRRRFRAPASLSGK